MKIKMITTMSGPTLSANPGDELNVADDFGRDLVNGGYAINLNPKIIETAVLETPENTSISMRKGRKKHK